MAFPSLPTLCPPSPPQKYLSVNVAFSSLTLPPPIFPPIMWQCFVIVLFYFYFEDNGIRTCVLFFHPVPMHMQFCKFYCPFPLAYNGLLFWKAERVLMCAQGVLHAFAHGTSVSSLIRRTFGESGVSTDVNSRGKILLNEIRTQVSRLQIHHSNHQAIPSCKEDKPSSHYKS